MNMISSMLSALRRIFIGYRTPPCMGINIDSSAIKIVELNTNTLKIKNYSIKVLNHGLISVINSSINDLDKVSSLISQQLTLFRHKIDNVAISIPYGSVIIRELIAPKTKSKLDLDNYVLEQLVINLGIDDIDFDYTIIETTDENYKLNVVVAKKDQLDEYQAMIQMTGTNIAAIDIEPFAIQYLYSILLKRKNFQNSVLVLDVGYHRIYGYVFQDNKPIYFNHINVSYNYIFEEYLQHNNIKLNNNENISVFTVEYLINNQIYLDNLVQTISTDVSKLIQIIKSSILVEKKITLTSDFMTYLIGDQALLPNLLDNIAANSNMNIYYGDELLRSLNNHVPRQHLIRLMTAISLATWGHKIDEN